MTLHADYEHPKYKDIYGITPLRDLRMIEQVADSYANRKEEDFEGGFHAMRMGLLCAIRLLSEANDELQRDAMSLYYTNHEECWQDDPTSDFYSYIVGFDVHNSSLESAYDKLNTPPSEIE